VLVAGLLRGLHVGRLYGLEKYTMFPPEALEGVLRGVDPVHLEPEQHPENGGVAHEDPVELAVPLKKQGFS
jgi:hypothetical protein